MTRRTEDPKIACQAPDGRWWMAYDDGCVWPVEVIGPSGWPGAIRVCPEAPAPDAGSVRSVNRRSVYDRGFNHPTFTAVTR